MRWMLRSKIHRATVTDARLDYEGSITVDADLLDKAGIWAGEKVTVVVIETGARFETYTIPGERGTGIVALNGAAARLAAVGDRVIIMGYELTDRPIKAEVLLVDAHNKVAKELSYRHTRLVCYSDGGSRGNPGPSAFANVIAADGEVVYEHSEFLGTHTNNFAEYSGLIGNIRRCIDMGADEAEFVMDSQLVIMQMKGEWKVNDRELVKLHEEAVELCTLIPKVSFRHIRRYQELIPRADALLNAEMDRHQRS